MIERFVLIKIKGVLHPNAGNNLDIEIAVEPNKKFDETEYLTLKGALMEIAVKIKHEMSLL